MKCNNYFANEERATHQSRRDKVVKAKLDNTGCALHFVISSYFTCYLPLRSPEQSIIISASMQTHAVRRPRLGALLKMVHVAHDANSNVLPATLASKAVFCEYCTIQPGTSDGCVMNIGD